MAVVIDDVVARVNFLIKPISIILDVYIKRISHRTINVIVGITVSRNVGNFRNSSDGIFSVT